MKKLFGEQDKALTCRYHSLQELPSSTKTKQSKDMISSKETSVILLRECINRLYGCSHAMKIQHQCKALMCDECWDKTVLKSNSSTNRKNERCKRPRGQRASENSNNRKHLKHNSCSAIETNCRKNKCPCGWPNTHD